MGLSGAFEKGNYRRVCDICGVLWRRSDLRALDNGMLACPDEAGERTEKGLDRLNARIKQPQLKVPKDAAPAIDVGTWAGVEGQVFTFIVGGPLTANRYLDITNGSGGAYGGVSILAVAEAARYVASVYSEGLRSARTLASALVALRTFADYLLSIQVNSPSAASGWQLTGVPSTGLAGGFATAIANPTVVTSEEVAAGGLALALAYQHLGDSKYRGGALAAATLLRRMQRCDLIDNSSGGSYTTSASGSGRLALGAWVNSWSVGTGADPAITPNHKYYAGDLVGLTFLAKIRSLISDLTIGDTTAPSGFTAATSAAISTAQSAESTFWSTSVVDASGSTIVGFGATAMKEYFRSGDSSGAGYHRWYYDDDTTTGTTVTGLNAAKGLRALYAYEGYSTQVAAIWTYLMAATSNSTYETSSTASPSQIRESQTGTYDPTIALATQLVVSGANKNNTSLYELATVGLMAGIQSARAAGAFKEAKEQLGLARSRYRKGPRDDQRDLLPLRGRCGLTYQTNFTESIGGSDRRVYDTLRASYIGAMWRSTPQAWNMTGH